MTNFHDGHYLQKIQRRTAFETVAEDHVFQYLLRASDLAYDLAVDGSVTPQNFDYRIPAGTKYKKFQLVRVCMLFADASMRYDRFLGFAALLPNGMLFQVVDIDGTTIIQHFGTDIVPLISTASFSNLAGVDAVFAGEAGPNILPIRWTIEKSGNKMTLYPNQIFRCVVQDDLTPATGIQIMVQGILRP